MKLHRFFSQHKIQGVSLTLHDRALLHQWLHVLKLQKGEEVVVFDGEGREYSACIESLDKKQAKLNIISSQNPGTEPRISITLYQALIKKDNFEIVLQKGTEVGVSAFMPVLAARSEKKRFNAERGRKIIQEAAEQSGRVKIPALYEMASLQDALTQAPKPVVFLDSHTGATFGSGTSKSVAKSLFVGPEGGWTEEELKMAKESGAAILSLGPRTLRAETAGPLAAGIILIAYQWQ